MKLFYFFILFIGFTACKEPSTFSLPLIADKNEVPPEKFKNLNEKMAWLGLTQVGITTTYDPAYVALTYPMGDVPQETGVCADVIVRAFRKMGIDLQQEIHQDMKANFSDYPQKWGLSSPDKNIDHRRVPNIRRWFERKGKSLALNAKDFKAGDVVSWDLGNGLVHIGIVSPQFASNGTPLILHNIGSGAEISDVLFSWEITGHYRYF